MDHAKFNVFYSTLKKYFSGFFIGLIKGYQLAISPYLGARCRFYPSCSEYAIEAIGRFGLSKGVLLALKRILRCQPMATGGFDPVPEKQE